MTLGTPRRRAAAWVVAAVALAMTGAGLAACGGSSSSSTATSTAGPTYTRPITATTGFDVTKNGYSFANYAVDDDARGLTPGEIQLLFGDDACERGTGDSCVLLPPGKVWMTAQNTTMSSGVCFGMAVSSWLMYKGVLKASDFGGTNAYKLKLTDNPSLQATIARYFVTQATSPTSEGQELTAKNVLAQLEDGWKQGKGYALGFYKRVDGQRTDGHAVTPIAITDLGDGKQGLTVYDNNYPGGTRTINVDTTQDSWSYSTTSDPSKDPDAYTGDASNTMFLYSTSTADSTQTCPFCSDSDQGNYVFLQGAAASNGATLSVTDQSGKALSGVTTVPWMTGDSTPPLLEVPKDVKFRVSVDSSKMTSSAEAKVTVVGPGWSDEISGQMPAGIKDSIDVDGATGNYTYSTSKGLTPALGYTVDQNHVGYSMAFTGLDIDGDGGQVSISNDATAKQLTVRTKDSGTSTLSYDLTRSDRTSDQRFKSPGVTLQNGASVVIQYGKWKGKGQSMPVGVDNDGNGTVDKLIPVK